MLNTTQMSILYASRWLQCSSHEGW